MGTRFDILVDTEDKAIGENIWLEIQSELIRLNKLFDRFNEESEVSKINKSAYISPVPVSSEMWEVLVACKKYHKKTLGLFDITLNNFNKVFLNEINKTVSFHQQDLHLDFGAYAKGYAIEKINSILTKHNIQNSFSNFGNSSIYALGTHPYGDYWGIGIENPYNKGEVLNEYKLKNEGMSTSGNMPSNPKHILNPVTGNFIEEKRIVCVKTKNAIEAEVLSTTMMIAQDNEKEKISGNFNVSDISIFKV